jgi:hypothetical protein
VFKEGDTITPNMYVDATHFYSGSFIVEKLDIDASNVEEAIKVDMEASLADGFITEPVWTP